MNLFDPDTCSITPQPAARCVPAGPRFPLQPLIDLAGSKATLALQVGVSPAAVTLAEPVGLGMDEADEWAIAVGYVPFIVWGCLWADTLDAELERCGEQLDIFEVAA